MRLEENVLLSTLTTFHIGGPARYVVRVSSLEDVREALEFARAQNKKWYVLGEGSNILAPDEGLDAVIIKIECMGLEREGSTHVVGAGEQWDSFVARTLREGMSGVENLSGIPGTVGAAPIQNIGAYGAEVKDTLAWVEALDVRTGELVRFSTSDCGFGYRTSRFKKDPSYIVVRVAFDLSRDSAVNISYKDLAQAFAGRTPTPAEVRQEVLRIRAHKFPDLTQEGTAGSFFLNPIVGEEVARNLLTLYPTMPQFPTQGGVKLSLAWILDTMLNLKGVQVGGARLFERQPLVIAATRDARSEDVRELARVVKKNVNDKVKIEIEEEVRMW